MLNRRQFALILPAGILVACSQNQAAVHNGADLTGSDLRYEMVRKIVNFEARRDPQGRIAVYRLDPDDGGGTFEVAGINDRYHEAEAKKLKSLVEMGKHAEAEDAAIRYIADYTDGRARNSDVDAIKFLLRDVAWNRGPTGAARTFQIALNVRVDGRVGPNTLAAMRRAERDPDRFISDIERARAIYEQPPYGRRRPGNRYWRGLQNRWQKASATARGYL